MEDIVKKRIQKIDNDGNFIIYWPKLIDSKEKKILRNCVLDLKIEKNIIYFLFFLF